MVIEGARRLIGITTSVRDRPGGAWRVARIVSLEYRLRSSSLHFPTRAPIHPPAGLACTQTPLRYLAAIRITAYNPRGAATTLPPVTFTYNARLQGGVTSFGPAPFETKTVASPGAAHYGDERGAAGTLLDLDSDGIPDRISVTEEQRVCTLIWRRGIRGGTFEREVRKSPLPTAPWSDEVAGPDGVYRPRLANERCTLNGQVTYRYYPVHETDPIKQTIPVPGRGVLSYHFLDFTGDGRVDLLTNVWAAVAHETFVPPSPFDRLFLLTRGARSPLGRRLAPEGGNPTSVPPILMTPEGGSGRYVWRVYRNAGDPNAVVLSPLTDAPFATVPMKVVTPGSAGEDCAPEPLPPSANDDLLDKGVFPSVSIPSLIDLDGDGFLDLVDVGKSAKALNFDGDWCVWFGTGTPSFRGPYRWKVPRIILAVREAGFNEEAPIDSTGERHIKRTTGAALQDINGDRLPDLVVQTSDRLLKTYLNTGSGFRLEPISLGVFSPVEIMQTDYSYSGDNGPVLDGNRGYRLRLLDVDGDGLPDLVSTSASDEDIAAAGRVFVRFNAGDHFNAPVEVPARWAQARRLLTFNKGEWQLATDFVDANGDGLADLASWASDGSSLTFSVSPGLPQAPDLLRTVENGRGLRVSFSYAVSTDQAVVSWNHSARNTPVDLPQPTWIVSALTVSGGFRTPDMVTRFTYADPRLLSPSAYRGVNERTQFVGMGRAQLDVRRSGGEPARETTRRFAYDESGAPQGRVVEERLYRREGDVRQLHRDTMNEWEWRPLFAGRTYAVTLRSTITRTTCMPDASETKCTSQTENVSRSEETWKPKNCGSAGQALYVRAIRREGIGLTAGNQDRRTLYHHLIVCGGVGQPDYRVLVDRTRFYAGEPGSGGSVFEQRGDTRVTYDDTGMAIQTDEWQDADTVATTKRTFDTKTGNLLRLTKPEQATTDGSGKGTVNTYDVQGLYVQKRVDELGHAVAMRHDVTTGSLLERRGPNAVTLASGKTVFERETWRVDGLGRTIAHAVSFDDRAAGYVLRKVTKTRYFDRTLPNRVRTEQLRAVGGSVWVTSDRTVDGLGRTLVETQHLDGGKSAITTYNYDGDGNVSAIDVPDPRRDDGTSVRYTYGHDGLGRLVSLTRPDESGIRIVYAGLNETVNEVAKDGSGSTRTQVFDPLGRLVAVREVYPNAEPAVTRYRYDGRDNVIGITGADGSVTRLEHDWGNRRVAIVRGDRTWRYTYDRNNNLVTEARPAPAGADPALHTATYAFDDLDRVTMVSFADLADPTAPDERALVSVRYAYDDGKNGLGRLRSIRLPFGQIRYTYEARGLVASEQRSFALSGIANVSDTQRAQRTYNALGQLMQSVWDDGQRWRMGYDRRGLVGRVDWYDPVTRAWKRVAAFDRSRAGQPRVRNSSFGQIRHYAYDALGRVVRDQILRQDGGTAIATRGYTFTDSGDLAAVSGDTAGVSAVSSYKYDAQHRLISASGPSGYTGTFTYSPAGNIESAKINSNGSSESRNVRYQYGARDPEAVDRLINRASTTTYGAFRYDLAGNMLERETPAGTASFAWDGLDRMRLVQNANGREVYFYDPTGTRVLAVNKDGVRFWFGESETHYTLNGTQTRRYLHLSDGNATLARVENRTNLEFQYPDTLQNLMLTLDKKGKIVANFS
jgi:YD repeat-containing protein